MVSSDGGAGGGPYLIEVPSWQTKTYNPLRDTPRLFLDFADMHPTEEGIKGFAKEYGNLTSGVPLRTTLFADWLDEELGIVAPEVAEDGTYETAGVSWQTWLEQAREVRRLVETQSTA